MAHNWRLWKETERALKLFKSGVTPILVATDVASRGLDIPQDQTTKGGKSSGGTRKADTKLAVKKTQAKGKAVKDPNKPKRPASAFFLFMEEFRKQFKEENPGNKSVAAVGKAGGAKWKTMSDSVNVSKLIIDCVAGMLDNIINMTFCYVNLISSY
ncbi:HMG1/2-like protein [Cynara cardunculus var. scolymus]|uniref:HMG1/2-like protein n=1 Tax=Cynara cardunculus var. scolymus TaxID=59895 RepID=UPI000D62A6EC|nr:HMG1/2-like protein [Cynara cardunculus var. scolymus]